MYFVHCRKSRNVYVVNGKWSKDQLMQGLNKNLSFFNSSAPSFTRQLHLTTIAKRSLLLQSSHSHTITAKKNKKKKKRRDTLFSLSFFLECRIFFPKTHNIFIIYYRPEVVCILITEPVGPKVMLAFPKAGWGSWSKRGVGMKGRNGGYQIPLKSRFLPKRKKRE